MKMILSAISFRSSCAYAISSRWGRRTACQFLTGKDLIESRGVIRLRGGKFTIRQFDHQQNRLFPPPSTNISTKFSTLINPSLELTDKMDTFEYNGAPGRVIFGSGTLSKLADEVARLNLKAPLLLSTPQQVEQAQKLEPLLNGKSAGIFTEATMHTPSHITEKALEYVKSTKADSVISIGGGSTIGLGKAISIRTGLPHICIPTTYAGSEMTPILGETQDGKKTTRSDPKILPGTVIYDVDLTMTLPASMSATSGVNAIAHSGMSKSSLKAS